MAFLPMCVVSTDCFDSAAIIGYRIRTVIRRCRAYTVRVLRRSFVIETVLIFLALSILLSGLPGPVG